MFRFRFISVPAALVVILFCGISAGYSEEYADLSAQEELLLELINQARRNPLDMAESMGMKREELLEAHPDLRAVLIYGLPPLRLNPLLNRTAAAHTADMLEHNYYAHESPDGSGYEERLAGGGYAALYSGESLGLLGFRNFVEPETAVKQIFQNIFLDELDPLRTEQRNILNPQLREAGISFRGGAFDLRESAVNAYLATCDFATHRNYAVQLGILRLVNEARHNPLRALEEAGLSEAVTRSVLGESGWVLDEGLPPLAWNENLFAAAKGHALDMIERKYFANVSPEGMEPEERVALAGYDAALVKETIGVFPFSGFEAPMLEALLIYLRMLKDELNPALDGPINIFDPQVTEIGVTLETVDSESLEDEPLKGYVLVADFAQPVAKRSFLVGNVYQDKDGDGRIDPAEGASRLTVVLNPTGWEAGGGATETGPVGSCQLPLPRSFSELIVAEGEETLARRVLFNLSGGNRLMDMTVALDAEVK